MTALLTDNLPLVAGAPNGIQKLRELILELAVRGKLVRQDPDDQPASELLEHISEERERLIANRVIKKQKAPTEIGDDEIPFDVPATWEWMRVAAIGHAWGQKTPDRDFNYIDVGCVDNIRGVISTPKVITAKAAPSRARKIVKPGTLLYSTIRPYLLNVAVVGEVYEHEPIASTAFAVVHPFVGMPARYFLWYLRSPTFIGYVESVQTGIAYPAINDGQFFHGVVPLPPLAEQQRIVAKVDELMALCDRLEARQVDAESAHAQLVQSLLDSLTQAADAEEFTASWRGLAEHFGALFSTGSSIEELQKCLLQLAMRGKLVLQDPCDEPASELLRLMADDKAARMHRGKAKESLPEIKPEEIPYELPPSWKWVRLGNICEFINGDRGKSYPNRSEYVSEGVPWINTGHIEPDGTLAPGRMHFITREKFESLNGGKIRSGDLVYCLRGATLGKTALVDPFDEGAIASSLMIIRPFRPSCNRYVYRYLTSQIGRDQLLRFDNGSAQPNLSANNVRLYVYPLPPLAEQNRIVAKVDELMALCDRLKVCLDHARQLQEHLASVLVEQAVT